MVELVSKSLMMVVLISWGVVNPVMAPAGKQDAVQVKLPPETSGTRVVLNSIPEQMGEGDVFIRCGAGLTVTVRSETGPSQPLACGVR